MRTLRTHLQEIEFAAISLHYRLTQPRFLPPFPELMLRRPLLQAGIERLATESFERLFTPPLPEDPTALRRYQRPAPPFAFQPRSGQQLPAASDTAILSCHLFGDGITLVNDLITTLDAIQPYSFANRQKDGTLIAVTAADASGKESTIWQKGMMKCADPPRITAAWHLDSLPMANDWRLEIITPARLLVQKKPLFQPGFRHLLPFILRRVTALTYFYSHLEIEGVAELIAMSSTIEEEAKEWQWDDWRRHTGDGLLSELGGVYGHLQLKGPLPDEIVDLLRLGSLMNIGKGAAYGAGAYRLRALS